MRRRAESERDPSARYAILRLVLQREGHADCAIAAIASYLGKSYEDVLIASSKVAKGNPIKGGLHGTEIVRTAKRFGIRLKALDWEQIDREEETGILYVKARINGDKYEEHCVLFHRGSIIDLRDGTVWDHDVYCRHYVADPTHLLVQA